MTYQYTEQEFEQAVAEMKAEILRDMGAVHNSKGERMPIEIDDYSKLHDYVDANEYGGFCDDARRAGWWTGEESGDDPGNDVVAKAQDRIHAWLASSAAIAERLRMPARENNTNSMAGYRCPKCGQEEALTVSATTAATLTDNGVSDWEGMDFTDESNAACTECDRTGPLSDFSIAVQHREHRLPYLTLGELRSATAHLPDSTPVTAGAPDGYSAEWLNLEMDPNLIPTEWPSDEMSSIILVTIDDFDTRQW